MFTALNMLDIIIQMVYYILYMIGCITDLYGGISHEYNHCWLWKGRRGSGGAA